MTISICMISDTHELHRELVIPKCDLLIHCGDITWNGKPAKVADFNKWAFELQDDGQVGEVICIAGNHDALAQRSPDQFRNILKDVTYLDEESTTFKGFKIYGMPWVPTYGNYAFMADRGEGMAEHTMKIPQCDILITHGPARYRQDMNGVGEHCGCDDLLDAIYNFKPKLHVCGHIHEGRGMSSASGILSINAANYVAANAPLAPPILIDFS